MLTKDVSMRFRQYTEQYFHRFSEWIKPLFVENQPELSSQRYAIRTDGSNISIIHLDHLNNQIELLGYDHLQCDEMENVPLVLSSYLTRQRQQQEKQFMPVYWLLSPEDYQIILIESLPVSDSEFAEALSFRVRSMINYPIEEAVLDYIKLPPKKSSVGNMIAAIVAKKTTLTIMVDALKQSHQIFGVIDIPELAMRNLTSLYEDDEKSTAFIYFYDNVVLLTITRQKMLYFSRRFIFANHSDSEAYEQLCLDFLRYFDYFQSQWRLPSPTRVFVADNKIDSAEVAVTLSKYLLLPVQPYRIKSIVDDSALLQTIEKSDLLTLGCALREDNANVKTGH